MDKKQNKMNEMFKGYLNYSNEEYKDIWQNSLIVVDTNILLNFYRYSNDTREALYDILDKLKNRLWIPYYVGKEYFNNRDKVMIDSYNDYDKLIKSTRESLDSIKNEINNRKNNQLKAKDKINELIENNISEITKLLEKEKEEKKPNFDNNNIDKNIITLLNDKIGENLESDEFEKVKKDGIERMKNQIPPGYKDSEKDENGDYYIFYSMIEKSKKVNKHIIFVTDDTKEDWFNKINGEIHGGRYELLDEFYKKTNHLLLIYTSDGFVKAVKKNLNITANRDDQVIDELRKVRKNMHDKEINNKNIYIYSNDYKHNLEKYISEELEKRNITELLGLKVLINKLEKYYIELQVSDSIKNDRKTYIKLNRELIDYVITFRDNMGNNTFINDNINEINRMIKSDITHETTINKQRIILKLESMIKYIERILKNKENKILIQNVN